MNSLEKVVVIAISFYSIETVFDSSLIAKGGQGRNRMDTSPIKLLDLLDF
jgi:hypothetical protein